MGKYDDDDKWQARERKSSPQYYMMDNGEWMMELDTVKNISNILLNKNTENVNTTYLS